MKKQFLLKSMMLLCMLFVGMGAWADEVVYYSNSCPKNGSNTAYATYYDVTVGSIGWKAPGNQYADGDWRLGGKSSTTVDRYLYTKTAIDKNITKIVVTHGTKTASSVGNITLNVYSTAALAAAGGTGDISSLSTAYVDNGSITFTRPAGHDWNNRFYRFTYPVNPGSSSSNKYAPVKSINFYHDNAAGSTPSGPAVESHNIALSVAAGTYNVAKNVKVTNYDNSYIYAYTTDGTTPALDEMLDPTGTSSVYDNANGINITTACTLKIVAYDEDSNTSNVVTADYVIKPDAPTYNVDGVSVSVSSKSFRTSAEVEIEAADGCDIYYTTDGTNPTTSSTEYTGAFTVTESTTLKAIAVDAYNNVSSYKTLTLSLIEGTLFAFDDADALTAWGIALPSSSAGTDLPNSKDFVADGITVQVNKGGSTNTRIWNSTGTYDLRLYGSSSSKGSIVVTAPTGYNVTSVIFEGSAVSMSNLTSKAWSGKQSSITFEATSNQKISNITVKVEHADFVVTTADTEFYSLYLDHAVTVPSNVTAYTGTLSENVLTLSPVEGTIPANTGVVFKTSTAGTATFVAAADVAPIANNDIHGVAVDTPVASIEAGTGNVILVLGVVDGNVCFAKPNSETLGANKAYIIAPAVNQSKGIRMVVDGDATGINTVEAVKANNAAYNLNGQRVNANTKGIVIINGKKMLNK